VNKFYALSINNSQSSFKYTTFEVLIELPNLDVCHNDTQKMCTFLFFRVVFLCLM